MRRAAARTASRSAAVVMGSRGGGGYSVGRAFLPGRPGRNARPTGTTPTAVRCTASRLTTPNDIRRCQVIDNWKDRSRVRQNAGGGAAIPHSGECGYGKSFLDAFSLPYQLDGFARRGGALSHGQHAARLPAGDVPQT